MCQIRPVINCIVYSLLLLNTSTVLPIRCAPLLRNIFLTNESTMVTSIKLNMFLVIGYSTVFVVFWILVIRMLYVMEPNNLLLQRYTMIFQEHTALVFAHLLDWCMWLCFISVLFNILQSLFSGCIGIAYNHTMADSYVRADLNILCSDRQESIMWSFMAVCLFILIQCTKVRMFRRLNQPEDRTNLNDIEVPQMRINNINSKELISRNTMKCLQQVEILYLTNNSIWILLNKLYNVIFIIALVCLLYENASNPGGKGSVYQVGIGIIITGGYLFLYIMTQPCKYGYLNRVYSAFYFQIILI